MAQDKVQAPNELGQLQALLGLMGGGGTTTTTSATNTAPLQGVLSQLQGVDYNALLQGIFQQAAGQIPGLQSAYGRAVGARSSGNAPMQAALQELLKATTLEGQKQIATQQNQNLATQATAASNLIGKQQTTAQNSQLGQLAGILGLAQAAKQLGGYKSIQDMFAELTGTAPTQTPAPVRDAVPIPVEQISAPQMSVAPMQPYNLLADIASYSTPASYEAPVNYAAPQDYSTPGGMSNAPAQWVPTVNLNAYVTPQEPAPEMSMAPQEWLTAPDVMSYFGAQ